MALKPNNINTIPQVGPINYRRGLTSAHKTELGIRAKINGGVLPYIAIGQVYRSSWYVSPNYRAIRSTE